MSIKAVVPINKSAKRRLPGARRGAQADPDQIIYVTIELRSVGDYASLEKWVLREGAKRPFRRRYFSAEKLASKFGASPADVQQVEHYLSACGITTAGVDLVRRTIRTKGTVAAYRKAFGVRLFLYHVGRTTYRGRSGKILLPPALRNIIVGVHGLDNRRIGMPHLAHPANGPGKPSLPPGMLTVERVVRAYGAPAKRSARGQCIALIELNELDGSGKPVGTGFSQEDVRIFFSRCGGPCPDISVVGIDGGGNFPSVADTDREVTLDIQIAAATAPGANIAVYFAPNTSSGLLNAMKAAIYDQIRKPSVISLSWGEIEDAGYYYSDQMVEALNRSFLEAAAMGITVICSSGDFGSMGVEKKLAGEPHVQFPASSPYVMSCGGTKLTLNNDAFSAEEVWNDGWKWGASGGGVSSRFKRPFYQRHHRVPLSKCRTQGRGVPDLAANGAPLSGYEIVYRGAESIAGGTSAAAPLIAGLIALANAGLHRRHESRSGFINPLLYQPGASAVFRDVVAGNNDIDGTLKKYAARCGWDPCTGLGSPIVDRLFAYLLGRSGN